MCPGCIAGDVFVIGGCAKCLVFVNVAVLLMFVSVATYGETLMLLFRNLQDVLLNSPGGSTMQWCAWRCLMGMILLVSIYF